MTTPLQQHQQPALLVGNNTTTSNTTDTSSSSSSSSSTIKQVVVHPLVLLSVLDHHTRRAEKEGRVIGTLLGRRDGNMVEVTNCFAVPHAERGDEVAIGKDFNKQMLNLHLRGNRKEAVVGWYATAASTTIADTSSLIHEFYATEVDDGDPVHVTVDTRLLQDQLNVCAYISVPVVVQGEVLANLFHQVPLKMESAEHETICLDQMAHPTKRRGVEQQQLSADGSPTTALQVSMEHLLELLETASAYVDSVVSGTTLPDSKIGRHIADTLNSVPRIQPAVFDKLYQDSLQDLLMVTYLSNITKTQLTIAEKLNASLGAV